MVTLLLETFPQHKARNKKNEHYHWICRHSIQIYCVNRIVTIVETCVGLI